MDHPAVRSAVALAVSALAAKRLTDLAVEDEVAAPLRELVWRKFPPETTRLGYLTTCKRCTSVWAGAAVALAARSRSGRLAAAALALSEAALLLGRAEQLAVARSSAAVDNGPTGSSALWE